MAFVPRISVIPYSLYMEIKPDIDPIHMEESGITIQLLIKNALVLLVLLKMLKF